MSTSIRRLGKYELRERLGQDQLAETWKAFDEQSQHLVIVRLLHAHLQNDAYFLSRFEREARELHALTQPHLLPIQDVQLLYPPQTQSTQAYLVFAYVEGQTLAEYIRSSSNMRNFPAVSEILSLFEALGSAIDYTRQKGIQFCNVRPGNVFLEQRSSSRSRMGVPLLINYEVATLLGNPPQLEQAAPYIAPEQVKGRAGDERSDIYLLGMILYEICTGERPFKAEQVGEVNRTILAPEKLNTRIPPALSRVIMRALAEDPAARFASAGALYDALKEAFATSSGQVASTQIPAPPVRAELPPRRKKRNWLVIALVALLILSLLGAGLSVLFTIMQKPAPIILSVVGHAYMESSGQIVDNSTVGLNDKLRVVLSDVPNPAAGNSYYLWLLSDVNVKPENALAFGTIPVQSGSVNYTYTTLEHKNLLASYSRLLITEEDTKAPPRVHSTDQTTWRYYTEIPQRAPSLGAPHLGAVRFLRFLLFESNKMLAQGIHGGSATVLLRNTQKVLEWAGSARDDWGQKRYDLIHRHFIRILDYVDGKAFVSADLPPGTPILADDTLAQNGLVSIVPGENPESYPPRAAFSILSYVQAVPGLSLERRKLGLDTEQDVRVNIEQHLQQVRVYARQLFQMNNQQLAQSSTLTLLNNMLEEARKAYSGEFDPTQGRFIGGALNDYNNLQLLASYDIAPFKQKT